MNVYYFIDDDVFVKEYNDYIDAAISIYSDHELSKKIFLIYGADGEIIITKSILFVFKSILFLKPPNYFWFKCFDSFRDAYNDVCFLVDEDPLTSIKRIGRRIAGKITGRMLGKIFR